MADVLFTVVVFGIPSDTETIVCLHNTSLYGFSQSARCWYKIKHLVALWVCVYKQPDIYILAELSSCWLFLRLNMAAMINVVLPILQEMRLNSRSVGRLVGSTFFPII